VSPFPSNFTLWVAKFLSDCEALFLERIEWDWELRPQQEEAQVVFE
jgi:hypothetical protein